MDILNLDKPFVNRIEVIDETGRVFIGYFSEKGAVVSFQDDGRTIKVFQSGLRLNV